MADPRLVVPYNDPYDSPIDPNFFNFGNPALEDVSNFHINNGPTPPLPLPQQQNYHGSIEEDSTINPPDFQNLVIQDHDMQNNFPNNGGGLGNFEQGGPSQVFGGDQGQRAFGENNLGLHNFCDVMPLTFWPEAPLSFACSCCQILREIVHTNGISLSKLEIHGRIGMINHAIHHQNIYGDPSSSSGPKYTMFDFCNRSIEDVKSFLMWYCMEQNLAGYYTMQDPLTSFYEALSIGLDWTEELNEDLVDWNPNSGVPSAEDDEMEQLEQLLEAELEKLPARASLAEQRERAGKMTLEDLSDYFHLPIGEAARKVKICPTVIKRVCRKSGLKRWPYRKVKSYVKRISVLKRALNSNDPGLRATTQAQINRLESEMTRICAGVAPTRLEI